MAILAKEAYAAGVGVTTLLAVRFTLAALVFWLVVAALRRPIAGAPRRAVLVGLALGAVGYSVQSGAFFSALRHIDASLTALLLYTYPALVFLAAVALGRERPTAPKTAALALATAGTALVLLGAGAGALNATGVLLAVGAAAAYTTYILVADTAAGRLDPWLLFALICTGGAATFLVTGAVSGALDTGFEARGWLYLTGIALFSTVLPVSTFLLGLERVGPATASIVSTLEPVVTVGLAMALFEERLSASQLAGGALVLAAVVVLQLRAAGAARGTVPAPAEARAAG